MFEDCQTPIDSDILRNFNRRTSISVLMRFRVDQFNCPTRWRRQHRLF